MIVAITQLTGVIVAIVIVLIVLLYGLGSIKKLSQVKAAPKSGLNRSIFTAVNEFLESNGAFHEQLSRLLNKLRIEKAKLNELKGKTKPIADTATNEEFQASLEFRIFEFEELRIDYVAIATQYQEIVDQAAQATLDKDIVALEQARRDVFDLGGRLTSLTEEFEEYKAKYSP